MALTDKLTAIADAIRGKTGGTDTLTLDAMATEIAAIETGGGGGVKVTEFAVTEDTDRSLWFNAQGIKLVRGLNYLCIGGALNGGSVADNRTGLIVHCMMMWDGTAVTAVNTSTTSVGSHLRGWHSSSNAWSIVTGASNNSFVSGGTSKYTIAEDGTLSFTTSATGVTTGNYVNSFFGAGNTYYLLQAETEVIC